MPRDTEREFVAPKRSETLREGDLVDGVYRVESFIARGGFAEIYAVRHERRGHACALKVLRADKDTPANREALIDEARTIDALPPTDSFVSMFDCGFDPARGIPYVVMELLKGQTLRAKMDALTRPVGPREALRVGVAIAVALAELHDRGFCHADLSPSNVFLIEDAGGVLAVKLLDLGAAISVTRPDSERRSVGTPGYRAPEQRDSSKSLFLPASDVHALGQILFELMTLERPFDDDAGRAAPRSVREVVPNTPRNVERLVAGMMAADPRDRPSSGRSVESSLRAALGALDAKASAEVFREHVLPPVDPDLTGTGTDQLPLHRRPIAPGRDFLEVVDGPPEVVGTRLLITERAHFLGRSAHWNDLVVTHESVSTRHCSVVLVQPGQLEIKDCGSRRGIVHEDGSRGSFTLWTGQVFRLGDLLLKLKLDVAG